MIGIRKVTLQRQDEDEVDREKYPLVHHPVIRTRPETKAKAIYTNNFFTSHIDGVDKEESPVLAWEMGRARSEIQVSKYVFDGMKPQWLWDNRCVQHTGTDDFIPAHRRMERTTIIGDIPF